MKKELTKEEALHRAAALCSKSEQCKKTIMEKLLKWGIFADEAEEVVDHLVDENYINHARYARAYVREKFRYNHWGRQKISQMLRMQRVEETFVQQAFEEISEEEYEQAIDTALRQKYNAEIKKAKDSSKGGSDPEEEDLPQANTYTNLYETRVKLARHLVSRGFETDLVMRRIDALLGE